MRDGEIPPERICDPVGKRFPSLGRDPERTPMQWNGEPGAGFSRNVDTWLPLAADFTSVNVARQANDPASLFSFYRRAIWFRKSAPALLEGSYRGLDSPPDTFVFVREHGVQRLLVALNFGAEPRTIELPASGKGAVALSTDDALAIAGSRIVLRPATGAVIEL